jgi:zinc protease
LSIAATLALGCGVAPTTTVPVRHRTPPAPPPPPPATARAVATPTPAPVAAATPPPVRRFRLPNGLSVVLQENHAAPVVALQAWVQVGAADEPPELAGIAHVFEHMLFKGTARRGVGQIAREIESAGGEINAWTSFDQTVYHVVLASRFVETGLDILADALQASAFDPGELQRELKVVLEEVKQGEDTPSRVLSQALFSTAFAKHPYRRPVIGTAKTVKSFTRDALVAFFRRHYVARNVTLVVVGDVDGARVEKRIEALFGKMAPGDEKAAPPARAREPEQRAPRVRVVSSDVKEAQLALAFHIPGVAHEDVAALDLAAVLLGQGESARLSTTLRRERQLVSDAYAYAYTPRDPGLFVVGAALPPKELPRATEALAAELFRLVEEPVSQAELDKARAIVESDTVYQKETVEGQARKLGFFETVAGGIEREAEYLRAVREATPESIRAALARYLVRENLTLAVLAPPSMAKPDYGGKLLTRVDRGRALAAERWRPRRALPPSAMASTGPVRVRLPSGVRLVVQRDPSVALVAMRAVWPGGLRLEDEKTNGVGHLISQMLVRGTVTRPRDAVVHELESLAGAIGGFSGRNSTGLRVEALSRHWDRALEILADCVLHPSFDEEELEKERRHVLEEIRTRDDNVSSEAFRLFQRALFPKHPYRLDVIGTTQSVTSLTRRRVVDHYRQAFPLDRLVISIVGDVDPEAVVERARALFGAEPALAAATAVAPSPRLEPPRPPESPISVERKRQKQQGHIVYGFLGTTLNDPDRYPLEVLTTILSGQGGRLFVELRDKRGLAYRVSAFHVEGVEPGYFAVYLATSPQNLTVALDGIRDELARAVAAPPSPEELDRAKRYLVGAHDISLQRKSALAAQLAFHAAYGLPDDEHLRYGERVLAVTAADVQRVARRFLDPRRAVTAIIRPDERPPEPARPHPPAPPKRQKSKPSPKRAVAKSAARRPSGR